ncbi:MAG: tripartite tricarboxylate transporter TctB family protein [Polynucleobacter sp.]
MRIYNRRDFNAGLFFMAIGVYFAIYAQDYSLGTANRMGPGYFPALLAVIMLALGLTVLVMAFLKVEEQEPPEATDWRGLVLVLGAVLAFALPHGAGRPTGRPAELRHSFRPMRWRSDWLHALNRQNSNAHREIGMQLHLA